VHPNLIKITGGCAVSHKTDNTQNWYNTKIMQGFNGEYSNVTLNILYTIGV
jgi:hypothetical protein